MNNYEKIKAMSIDEMAEFISAIEFCGDTDCNTSSTFDSCDPYDVCPFNGYNEMGDGELC